MKILILIIAFFCCPLLFADQNIINGYLWRTWSENEKLIFIAGFLQGNYSVLTYLNKNNFIDPKRWDEFIELDLGGIRPDRIVYEVDQFYLKTGLFRAPLWIVVYIRNLWKSFSASELGAFI